MRRVFRLSSVLLCISLTATSQGINFEHGNFAAACAKAKAENKLVFIDFYTSWCGPCRQMANTVFKQENVGQFINSSFVSLKIDGEKGEGKALVAKYKIQYYPTYLFLDDKGAVYNKGVGYCKDSVFLNIAATARQEFTNPYSLPRLKAQYAVKKKDTAFLRLYIDKLRANQMHVFGEIEQYLAVQTAMRPGSPEMMAFLIKHPRELYYGGRAAKVLEQYREDFHRQADNLQREALQFANDMLLSNTRIYALEAGNEAALKNYIAAKNKTGALPGSYGKGEGDWLEFYFATGNWKKFGKQANHWLDSICAQLKPVAPAKKGVVQSPEQKAAEAAIYRGTFTVSENAKRYYDHFRDEKEVVQKAMRWMKAALEIFPQNSPALTFYANLLYESGDTTNAILVKTKALNSLPGNSLHRNIVQNNLTHMQKGELLEEE
jgi:thiol-disulfide isomerase/thioredoxin